MSNLVVLIVNRNCFFGNGTIISVGDNNNDRDCDNKTINDD